MCLERPVVYSNLNRLRKELGDQMFPLIPLTYYSHAQALRFTPEIPFVVKIGSVEAGYGKMKINSTEQLDDFRSCLSMHSDYVTAEKYVEKREYDIRVQKIGDHLRAYKRVGNNWKTNVGPSVLDEIEVTEQFKRWADNAGKLFGGLDILSVDAIHCSDGRDYILEINDTATGLAPNNEKTDMEFIADLVMQKLDQESARKKEH